MTYLTPLRIALIGGVLGWCGCFNLQPKSDPTRYYVLESLATFGATPTNPIAENLSLGLVPLDLPGYLDTSRITVRKGSYETEYLEFHLWAENLQVGILRALRLNLASLLGTRNIYLQTWPRDSVQLEVHVILSRFEFTESGQALLEADWHLTGPNGKGSKGSGLVREVREVGPLGDDLNPAVSALSELLGELSREIAAGVAISR